MTSPEACETCDCCWEPDCRHGCEQPNCLCRLPVVGDLVFLPNRLAPDHPGHASAAEIFADPGRVVSIDDGWAMVDRGSWGQFGCPIGDLLLAQPASSAGPDSDAPADR